MSTQTLPSKDGPLQLFKLTESLYLGILEKSGIFPKKPQKKSQEDSHWPDLPHMFISEPITLAQVQANWLEPGHMVTASQGEGW